MYGEAVPAVPEMTSHEPPSAYIPLDPYNTVTVSGANVQAVKRERVDGKEVENVVEEDTGNNTTNAASVNTKRIKRST